MIDTKSRDIDSIMQQIGENIDDLIAESIDPASIYTILTYEEGWWRARITWVGIPDRYNAPTLKRALTSEELRILRQAKQQAAVPDA